MRCFLAAAAVLFVAATAAAQTPTATQSKFFALDIAAPDVATAQAYVYKFYFDNATNGLTFTPQVKCALEPATAPLITCTVPIPAFTPGQHTATVTASNEAGESAKSAPFVFVFVAIPSPPTNIRLR